jgi:hypothetical protein
MVRLQTFWSRWQRYSSQHATVLTWVKILIVFGLFWAYSFKMLDPDFGWHLSAGNYIREHWIPAYDIYTYTARSYRWIDHEWGNDVIVSFLYQLGGYTLTSAAFGAVWAASICLFRRRVRLPILLLAVVALIPYVGIRPTVWTVFSLALLLQLSSIASKRVLFYIPFLFLVWANLHGGFIIGLALLGYFFIRDRRPAWLLVLLASLLASFINPYGPRLYVEIYHTLFDPALHKEITEWQSFYLRPTGWLLIGLWSIGFWLYDRQRLRNWMSVTPILIVASMSATRNLPLFVVSSLRDFDRYLVLFKLPRDLDRPRKILVASFSALILTIAGFYLITSYLPWGNRFDSYPVQAVAYLKQHNCPGNLFNDYSYGGYLIWKLPSVPVYIDGRMPSWHDPSGTTYISRYLAVLHKTAVQRREFTRYNIRCALLANTSADKRLVKSLKNQGWEAVSSGNDAVLLTTPSKTRGYK